MKSDSKSSSQMNLLPSSLWKDRVLHFPDLFTKIYENELRSKGLFEKASTPHKKSPFSVGKTKQQTIDQFIDRFIVCASRVEYFLIDPGNDFPRFSQLLKDFFSYRNISILDAPCGAGAGISALITTLYTLRREGVLPSNPVSIHIMGADHSPWAIEIYRSVINALQESVRDQRIFIEGQCQLWDATVSGETPALIRTWVESSRQSEKLLKLVSNFGAIKTTSKFCEFKKSLELLPSGKKAMFLWLEPRPIRLSVRIFQSIANFLFRSFFRSYWPTRFKSIRYSCFDPIRKEISRRSVCLFYFSESGTDIG